MCILFQTLSLLDLAPLETNSGVGPQQHQLVAELSQSHWYMATLRSNSRNTLGTRCDLVLLQVSLQGFGSACHSMSETGLPGHIDSCVVKSVRKLTSSSGIWNSKGASKTMLCLYMPVSGDP